MDDKTNVFGIFYLTKLAVPYMKAAKMGHIINISSIAGITGMENLSVYNATKFAVKGMSESLYKELRPHGIKLTCILPGSIQTDFFNDIEGLSPSGTMLQAAEVADSIVYCLESSNSFHPVNFEIRPFKTLV
jgi:short-subunit dehydrogenase